MVRVLVKGFARPYSEETLRMIFGPFGTVGAIEVKARSVIVDYSTRNEAEHAISVLQSRRLADASVLVLDIFYNPEKRVAVRNEYPADVIVESMAWFGEIYNVKETPGYVYIDYYDGAAAKRALGSLVEVDDNGRAAHYRDRPDGGASLDKYLGRGCAQRQTGPRDGGAGVRMGDARRMEEGKIENTRAGRFLKISKMPSALVEDRQTLFIYNLPARCSEDDLYRLFGRYGDIVSCGVKAERGYINFARAVSALRAYKHMDGNIFKSNRMRLKIKGQ